MRCGQEPGVSSNKSTNLELQLALFGAESSWKPDLSFPDIPSGTFLSLDTETFDPGLMELGPGFIRGTAHVKGIAVGNEEKNYATYLPIAHGDGEDLDRDQVLRYIAYQVGRTDIKLTGANLMYELEALWSLGIEIKAPLYDVQVAEPLIDEERPGGFNLDNLGYVYESEGKDKRMLDEALIAHGLYQRKKGKTFPDYGKIGLLPSKNVGPYATQDVLLPSRIIRKQLKLLEEEATMDVFRLEQELQPVLWAMRLKGVRVDVERAVGLVPDLIIDENVLLRKMRDATDLKVDPDSSKSLAIACDKLGIEYNLTSKGNPSFTAEFLEQNAKIYPFLDDVLTFRKLTKMRRDFIVGMIIEKPVDDRVHPNWHQLRGAATQDEDDGDPNGVRGGRIAATKPNLTQIPARHPKWGPLIRSLFIPDEGGRWCKCDYEQQEPRIQLEYAVRKQLPGAMESLQRYIENPAIDYHQLVADLCTERSGRLVARRPAKTINLGLSYGMGQEKLARQLGMALPDAKALFAVYHAAVPYVQLLGNMAEAQAQTYGYVRTLLGRRRHFRDWEPAYRSFLVTPRRNYDEAVKAWKSVRRAMTRKAWNAIVQGSAADQTKTAIVRLHRIGLTPQVQVYDELNSTIYDDQQAWMMKREMEEALPGLSVPFLTTPEVGSSWGNLRTLQ